MKHFTTANVVSILSHKGQDTRYRYVTLDDGVEIGSIQQLRTAGEFKAFIWARAYRGLVLNGYATTSRGAIEDLVAQHNRILQGELEDQD